MFMVGISVVMENIKQQNKTEKAPPSWWAYGPHHGVIPINAVGNKDQQTMCNQKQLYTVYGACEIGI
jgi:hypothetical protein